MADHPDEGMSTGTPAPTGTGITIQREPGGPGEAAPGKRDDDAGGGEGEHGLAHAPHGALKVLVRIHRRACPG